MSYWIYKHLKGKNIVVGTGTSLDTFRLQLLIAKHLKKSIQDINTLVLGEHGSNMTPIWSQTTVHGKSISELVTKDDLEKLTLTLKNSATEIRKTEVATKYGVSLCALAILESYIAPNKRRLVLSFSTKKIEEISRDPIFLSWLCEIGNHSVSPVEKIKMNEAEKEHLEKAIDAINSTTSL
jgi:L-lactate dehydrogenase